MKKYRKSLEIRLYARLALFWSQIFRPQIIPKEITYPLSYMLSVLQHPSPAWTPTFQEDVLAVIGNELSHSYVSAQLSYATSI